MHEKETTCGQKEIKALLLKSFFESKTRNPAFSLRSFSFRLGVQAPVISEIFNGKRLVTRKLAEKILEALKIDESEKRKILIHFPSRQVRSKKKTNHTIDGSIFRLVSDWWYVAIISLAETPNCSADPESISKKLNIPVIDANEAIQKLTQLGLVSKENNLLKSTGKYLRFSSKIPNEAIKKHHQQGLHLASNALQEIDLELREFGSITFRGDPELLELARKKLRLVRNEISSIMNTSSATEVYRLQVQLFPLTKNKD
jgi:uncharacterized protein (TIGR02147 family)